MLTRRAGLIASLAASAAAATAPALAEAAPEIGEDGLHRAPWLHESFLDLGADHAEAAEEGKHLAVLFEQRGCPYCRELHQVNFARPAILDYMTAHFVTVRLDLWGARAVTDFDGETHEERALAGVWGVNFTPTMAFFPAARVGATDARAAEAFRMPGYFKPFHFLSSLEYVATGEWEKQPFQRYLQDKFAAIEARGEKPEVW